MSLYSENARVFDSLRASEPQSLRALRASEPQSLRASEPQSLRASGLECSCEKTIGRNEYTDKQHRVSIAASYISISVLFHRGVLKGFVRLVVLSQKKGIIFEW